VKKWGKKKRQNHLSTHSFVPFTIKGTVCERIKGRNFWEFFNFLKKSEVCRTAALVFTHAVVEYECQYFILFLAGVGRGQFCNVAKMAMIHRKAMTI
jgi:hypothetical protein